MKLLTLSVLLFSTSALAQQAYVISNVPGDFDVKIIAPACTQNGDAASAEFVLFRKGQSKELQRLRSIKGCADEPGPSETVSYDSEEQTDFYVGDYNFDGTTDLALYDGNEGGYGSPVYKIYLFSKSKNRFVYHASLTKLTYSLGMFEVDSRNRMLYVDSKDGCCFHRTQGYRVVNDKPLKVYEHTVDGAMPGSFTPKVTTRKLINGRWRTWGRSSAARISFDRGKTGKTFSVSLTKNEPLKWFKFGAGAGQILSVSKSSADADVSVVDFDGDISGYESHETFEKDGTLFARLKGTGDYYIQVSAEKAMSVVLTVTVEKDNGRIVFPSDQPSKTVEGVRKEDEGEKKQYLDRMKDAGDKLPVAMDARALLGADRKNCPSKALDCRSPEGAGWLRILREVKSITTSIGILNII